MQNEKQYKVISPLGNIVNFKEKMTEKELREFALSLLNEQDFAEVWREKIQKDEVKQVIEWLGNLGYQVQEL